MADLASAGTLFLVSWLLLISIQSILLNYISSYASSTLQCVAYTLSVLRPRDWRVQHWNCTRCALELLSLIRLGYLRVNPLNNFIRYYLTLILSNTFGSISGNIIEIAFSLESIRKIDTGALIISVQATTAIFTYSFEESLKSLRQQLHFIYILWVLQWETSIATIPHPSA